MAEILYTRGPSSPSYMRMGNARPFYSPAIPKRPIGSYESPSEMSGRRRLGAGSVNIDSVTMIAALGGGIAVLASKALPEPGPVIAKVLGYGAMGFAVYRAFFEGGGAEAAVDKNAPGTPVQGAAISISETNAFSKVSGAFMSPVAGQKVGTGWLSFHYPVRIVLSNNSSSLVSFYYQIISVEDPKYVWLVDEKYNAQVKGQVAQSYITLRPKEQRTIDLNLEPVTTGLLATNKVDIQLMLQKRQSAESPWQDMGAPVSFEYSRNN